MYATVQEVVTALVRAIEVDHGPMPVRELRPAIKELTTAIQADVKLNPSLDLTDWNEETVDAMVMGDESGEPPARLVARWPCLHVALNLLLS